MNIVNKLTLRHLKENKGRTVITTFGICVSVAMITAVFVASASFINLLGEITWFAEGHYHAEMSNCSYEQIQRLKSDKRISKVGIEQYILEEESFKISDKNNKSSAKGMIYSGDITNLEQIITQDYEGSIPKNDNEIAVEKIFIENRKLDWKIGDSVKVPVGYYEADEENEVFVQTGVKTYRITAILNNNAPTVSMYPILRGFDSSKISSGAKQTYSVLINLATVDSKSLDTLEKIVSDYGIKNCNPNKDYLETKYAIPEGGMLMSTIIPMSLVILAIIIVASVILIYNAFGMSLSERVRYLGMLASVGATKRQKRSSIYFEGFILGIIGIPLGIIGGVIGIGITLKAIGNDIISTGMVLGITDSNISMKIIVPIWAVLGIILVSALTIFISAYIPSRKASKITPINAIRQQDEVKLKSKKLKSPKLIRKIFGYEGEIAHKNLKRNGRKSRVITASIALSVILFLSCNYFCDIFSQAVGFEATCPYQIQILTSFDDKNPVIEKIKDENNIDDFYCVSNYLSDQESLTQGIENKFFNKENLTNQYKDFFNKDKYIYINAVDDSDFIELCENNNIDYEKYFKATEPNVLLMNNFIHSDALVKPFNKGALNSKIKIDSKTLTIADFVDYDSNSYICNLNSKNTVSFYIPESIYYSEVAESSNYLIGIETQEHEKICNDLYNDLENEGFSDFYVQDFAESFQLMNTLIYVLQVLVYGFIALISLITIANIVNTISTSIDLRRKEFAMLKSVGTAPKGFVKMIILESFFYAFKALVFAIPISILASFGINAAVQSSEIFAFEVNIPLYSGVIAAVFAIVGISMLISLSKLKNDNIADTLKEDII